VKLVHVIYDLEVGEYQHCEIPPPSFLKFSYPQSTEIREFLEHPLKPPIRAHPPAVLRGGGGVAAEIKTGYATLSRNNNFGHSPKLVLVKISTRQN